MPTLNSPTIREAAGFVTDPADPTRINEFAIFWLEEVAIRMMAFQRQLKIPKQEHTGAHVLLNILLRIDDTRLHAAPLDPAVDQKLKYTRYAPSIITRGEIEVMGLSIPRFSLRCYLSTESQGKATADFMNMRRLHEESRYVRKTWELDKGPNPDSDFIPLEKLARKLQVSVTRGPSPESLVKISSPIADCFLKYRNPDEAYHLLEVPLGLHYGECQSANDDFKGTPYVQGTSLTGMCAQAVCFMANSILLEYAKSLSGIAEISLIASERRGRFAMLQGLTPRDVERYFCSPVVELWTERQFASPVLTRAVTSNQGMLLNSWFSESLSSYVRSGFPVILPCDLAKLNPLYATHELVKEEFLTPPISPEESVAEEMVPHFVCVVGVRRQPISSSEFVVNDPAFLPFLKLTAEQLRGASLDEANRPMYMAVVPARVKMALNAVLREGRREMWGLREFVFRNFERFRPEWQILPIDERGERRDPKFRLFHIRGGASEFLHFMQREMVSSAMAHRAAAWAARRNGDRGRMVDGQWVWMQYTGSYLWLWNAEKELEINQPPAELLKHHMLFACDDAREWEPASEVASPTEDAAEVAPPVTKNDFSQLAVGLINSFGAINYDEALAAWPAGIGRAEIYCFLRKEWLSFCTGNHASAIPEKLKVRGAVSALMKTRMLGLTTLDAIVERCAYAIDAKLQGPDIKVGSFATFIPEISSHIAEERDDAIAALKFLVEVAAQLRDVCGHKEMKFIEIVGGSRIQGVSYGWNNKSRVPAQAMIVPHEDSVLELLIDSLRQVAAHASKHNIWLALEMEPGPLHLLNGLGPIEKVLQDGSLAHAVGLNLDLAHFCLLGKIQPDQLASTTRERILGVHISGHSKGHLGDLHVNALNQLTDGVFDTWLNYLAGLARDGIAANDGRIKFDGTINVEMESCRCEEEVKSSCDTLFAYLQSDGSQI
ncbi:MAG TPA: sugar phosphate isomerase/epimerase [Chthoniobacteraceae bacterium]|nr:sugar phosphate isomerase/epimerase [Chthoniobacteraceae bacterium]